MPLIPTQPGQGAAIGAAAAEKSPVAVATSAAKSELAATTVAAGAAVTSNSDPAAGLNHPVIGWRNVLTSAIATSDDANSAQAPRVLTYSTWDRYQTASSSARLIITLPSPQPVDYIAVAGHNLDLVGGSITAETRASVGGTLVAVPGSIAADSKSTAGMLLFASRTAQVIELVISTSGPTLVAVVMAGLRLTMQRASYAGVTPSSLTEMVQRSPKLSDSGQFLGTQIVRKGVKTKAQFRHLTDDWYRSNFEPFTIHARTLPFFYAWNPQEDPGGVVYGWMDGDPAPEKMGIRDMLSVGFEIMGHR